MNRAEETNPRTDLPMSLDDDMGWTASSPEPESPTVTCAGGGALAVEPGWDDEEPEEEVPVAYGTFLLGKAEYAVDTRWLREVVPFPENVAPVPLSADSVLGIFSLRGDTMPIVDLARILGEGSEDSQADRRVAIIDDGSKSIGIVVDWTGEVVQPTAEEVHPVEHDHCTRGSVVDGVLSLEGGERFVQLLSVRLIGELDSVPRASSGRFEADEELEQARFESAVVARVGDFEFAFPMSAMFEIQDDLPIQTSPEYFRYCEGVVQVRGEPRPVMNVRSALGLERRDDARRILFLRHESSCVGLVVDSLVETLEYPASWRMKLPDLLDSQVTTMCREVLATADGRHLFLVDPAALFDNYAIRNADGALRTVDRDGTGKRAKAGVGEHEGSFLTFLVGKQALSVALDEVREVQEQAEGVFMTAAAEGGAVAGLMNIRGEVVPLIDVARRVGVEPHVEQDQRVVVVVEVRGEPYGLLVDQITDIARVTSAVAWNQQKMPGIPSMQRGVMSCMRTTLLVDRDEGEDSLMLAVIDVQKLVEGVDVAGLTES